jgi:UDP-N-acetylglucosamine 2-epimerase (non-hydrolysing)
MVAGVELKVLSIFGTRPEAIKMAPVVQALETTPGVTSVVCVTGQHRQMLDQVLKLFAITPEHDLSVMAPGQTLNAVTSKMIAALDPVLEEVAPDMVLVHGDTSTAMAGAVAAFHRRIPIGHVEAGLRTYDLSQPFPEEMNRRVVDMTSDLLFAPTIKSRANLEQEALQGQILVTGNTVIDALNQVAAKIDGDRSLRTKIDAALPILDPHRRMVLVTGHRRENFGGGFDEICTALSLLARRDDVEVVFPVHLNPNVREPVMKKLGAFRNIHLIEPQDYLPFVRLMQRADLILTDSGGVQEEAPALGKPVLVMRDVTERPEAVEAGTAMLVGANCNSIVSNVGRLLDDGEAREAFAQRRNPYGDGHAAGRIVGALQGQAIHEFIEGSPAPQTAERRIA